MKKIIFFMIMVVLMSFSVLASSITRSVPATVNPSSTFTITYTATNIPSKWGASITESVSGGCKFPSGSSTYNTVMLSEDGLTKTVQITAPASGSCTFTGDYKFDVQSIVTFASTTTTIQSGNNDQGTCTPSQSTNTCGIDNCGNQYNKCSTGYTCSNSVCVANTNNNQTITKTCQFYQNTKTDGNCELNMTMVWIGVAVVGGLIVLSMLKK